MHRVRVRVFDVRSQGPSLYRRPCPLQPRRFVQSPSSPSSVVLRCVQSLSSRPCLSGCARLSRPLQSSGIAHCVPCTARSSSDRPHNSIPLSMLRPRPHHARTLRWSQRPSSNPRNLNTLEGRAPNQTEPQSCPTRNGRFVQVCFSSLSAAPQRSDATPVDTHPCLAYLFVPFLNVNISFINVHAT